MGWLLLGLIAPEMVAYTAWRQSRISSKLGKDIQRLFRSSARTGWSSTQCFYAVMGGLAFSMPSDSTIMPGKRTRLTLTPRGILFIASQRRELLPEIPEETILDKSKANGLAKTLVCLQATWFCVQCLHRLISKMPLSLLELNTFAHSICTLAIYWLWWNKPLDVSEPTLLYAGESDGLKQTLALMCLASELDNNSAEFDLFQAAPKQYSGSADALGPLILYRDVENTRKYVRIRYHPEHKDLGPARLESTAFSSHPPENDSAWTRFNVKAKEGLRFRPGRRAHHQMRSQNSTDYRLYMEQTLSGFCYERVKGLFMAPEQIGVTNFSRPHIYLGSRDVERWKCASQALDMFGLLERHDDGQYFLKGQYVYNKLYVEGPKDKELQLHNSLCDRVPNWPLDINMRSMKASQPLSIAFVGFLAAGACYGGLHLMAWDAPFSSSAESFLWRTSGIVLVAAAPLCAVLYTSLEWFENGISEWATEPLRHRGTRFVRVIIVWFQIWLSAGFWLVSILLVALAASYVVARVYLVVESFLNISHLPEEVFEIPTWTRYFPHLM